MNKIGPKVKKFDPKEFIPQSWRIPSSGQHFYGQHRYGLSEYKNGCTDRSKLYHPLLVFIMTFVYSFKYINNFRIIFINLFNCFQKSIKSLQKRRHLIQRNALTIIFWYFLQLWGMYFFGSNFSSFVTFLIILKNNFQEIFENYENFSQLCLRV